MTVIAYRDGIVAADSLTTRDYRRIGIRRGHPLLPRLVG